MKPIIALLVCLTCGYAVAADKADEPRLVRIVLTGGQQALGELRSETDAEWKLLNLKTLDEVTLKKENASVAPKPLEDAEAIAAVGLPAFLGWKVARVTGGAQAGKVAQITESALYVTLGKRDRLMAQQKLTVFRDGAELKDPDTGEVLGRERTKIALLEVVELDEKFCKAIVQGKAEIGPKIGDRVIPSQTERAIAILPWVGVNGGELSIGKTMAEQLTTGLVKNGIEVVDRTLLDKALDELAFQQTDLVDPESAQRVGKLIGAYAIMTGKIVPKPPSQLPEAHLRLIEVSTGKILFATSQLVANKRIAEVENPPPPRAVVRAPIVAKAPTVMGAPNPVPDTLIGQWRFREYLFELQPDGKAVFLAPDRLKNDPGEWRWVGGSTGTFNLKWRHRGNAPWETWNVKNANAISNGDEWRRVAR